MIGITIKKDALPPFIEELDVPALISDYIKDELQLDNMAVLMGANVASDVASDCFVEATVASYNIRWESLGCFINQPTHLLTVPTV